MQKPKLLKTNDEPELGDMLLGEEYYHDELLSDGKIKDKYSELEYAYFDALNRLGWVGLNYFAEVPDYTKFMYKCPYIDNTYFWFIPIAIMSSDIQKYKSYIPSLSWRSEMMFDFEWTESQSPINEYFEYESNITQACMGHGYTHGTLPTDGNGGRQLITIKLDNGDFVVAVSHIWYNK
jgi:hypothetical protein